MKKIFILFFIVLCSFLTTNTLLFAQNESKDKGQFSGDLQTNARFYERDSKRDADSLAVYDYLKYGVDSWFTLNYRVNGFDMGVRFDIHHNSMIFNPTNHANKQGLGRWYIAKSVGKLDLMVGNIYEQFGTGATLRTYEARALGIDQSILGLRVNYNINKDWRLKFITGKLKNQFLLDEINLYDPIIKGFSIDGHIKLSKKVHLTPGASVVNRTFTNDEMNTIVDVVQTLPKEEQFVPMYNTYAFSLWNTLRIGKFRWRFETAAKTSDVLQDTRGNWFEAGHGLLLYNTLTYSRKGFGIVFQAKYTENFDFRVSPNEIINAGIINYLPALTRVNSYRLTGRYNAATQALGEMAFQTDITYTPVRGLTFTANFSNISNHEKIDSLYFREVYVDASWKPRKSPWKFNLGVQMVDYNRWVFEQKGDFVNTLTPFSEIVYKFDRKKSLKTEFSYMLTKRNYKLGGKEDPKPNSPQDLGDWFWYLFEFSVAPHWSISVADMYNFERRLHYPTFAASYTLKTSFIALSYAKQPDGIVCTGGICRYEPAFSGVKLDITTSF